MDSMWRNPCSRRWKNSWQLCERKYFGCLYFRKLLKEQLDSVRSMILVIGGLIGCIMASIAGTDQLYQHDYYQYHHPPP